VTTTGLETGLTSAVGAIAAANLTETIDAVADLTIFIPVNQAFDAIGNILANASIETLQTVLTYHAVTGSVLFSGDLSNTTVPSVQGNDLTVTVTDDAVFVNTAKVVIPNVILYNGVAHVIDS
jgi:uncharacterized surface protein with fasciclin (FAS1) repeats